MSSRPSARYNDPGYFYNPAKLIRIFAILSVVMTLGIFAMIYADWKRPWKDDQNTQRKWEARKLELEAMILSARTQSARAEIRKEEEQALEEFASKEDELKALQVPLAKARGLFADADSKYKAQKQFTGEAIYVWEHAHGEDARREATEHLAAMRDKEARLKAEVSRAQAIVDRLVADEKELRKALDAIVEKVRKNNSIRKLMLVEAARDKKRFVNPLREAPLIDFLAPPTKVEQVVLENIVDNYEFATPSKGRPLRDLPHRHRAPRLRGGQVAHRGTLDGRGPGEGRADRERRLRLRLHAARFGVGTRSSRITRIRTRRTCCGRWRSTTRRSTCSSSTTTRTTARSRRTAIS